MICLVDHAMARDGSLHKVEMKEAIQQHAQEK